MTQKQDQGGPTAGMPETRDAFPTTADYPRFQRRLVMVVMSLLLVWLLIDFLQKFASILQPLLVACFIVYLILPLHQFLTRRGISSTVAYVCILAIVLMVFLGFGQLLYANLGGDDTAPWERYEQGVDQLIQKTLSYVPIEVPNRPQWSLRKLLASDPRVNAQLRTWAQTALGELFGIVTSGFVVFIYLLFLIAEKASFPRRLGQAFGENQAGRLMEIISSINAAIAQYIGIKSFISFLQGFLSLIVFLIFGIDFAVVWGFLIFILNFVPYFGSLVAVGLPIVLSFVQYADQPWKGILVAVSLFAIQRASDDYLEPRLTGQKLGVSPLLVLLSLAFWGSIWGIIGMILAVPLTVIIKIVLENIAETRPIATLMSNR